MGITYEDLEVCVDALALMAIRALEAEGSISPMFFAHDGYRICKSHDPIDGGYLFHVSVSRHGQPVPWEVAEQYAAVVVPAVSSWERYDDSKTATHLYEINS